MKVNQIIQNESVNQIEWTELVFYIHENFFQVLGLQNKLKDAIPILKSALKLDPSARVIHQELSNLTEKARKEAENEKSLYQKMLGINNDECHHENEHVLVKTVKYLKNNFHWTIDLHFCQPQ